MLNAYPVQQTFLTVLCSPPLSRAEGHIALGNRFSCPRVWLGPPRLTTIHLFGSPPDFRAGGSSLVGNDDVVNLETLKISNGISYEKSSPSSPLPLSLNGFIPELWGPYRPLL